MHIDEQRLWFLRGVLAAFASSGQVVHSNELRRLCRLDQEQLGAYLAAAREGVRAGEPDFSSIVVTENGAPGTGDDDAALRRWPSTLRQTHAFWGDRRRMDNERFVKEWDRLPSFPAPSDPRD